MFSLARRLLVQSSSNRKLLLSTMSSGSINKRPVNATIPAKVGDLLSEVDTPSLVVNKAALERNLLRMRDYVASVNTDHRRVLFRPHTKTHKCPALAKLQIELGGATGVCCQKLDEVEAMLDGGVMDVFLTNQCVGARKITRLCELAQRRGAKLSVLVDDLDNTRDLARHAQDAGIHLDVLIEVNGGQDRCGLNIDSDGGPSLAVQLAQEVRASGPALTFKGIHCYGGWLQHVRTVAERRDKVMNGPVACAQKAVGVLQEAGVDCEIVTGAGTGSYRMETEAGVHNELQPGSYCFMDHDYGLNEDGHDVFENALFLHATVVSKANDERRAVIDAGLKASSLDSGPPRLVSGLVSVNSGGGGDAATGVEFRTGGDEHGILVGDYCRSLRVGDTVRLVPGHIDPTVNMHHFLVVVSDDDEEVRGAVKAAGEQLPCSDKGDGSDRNGGNGDSGRWGTDEPRVVAIWEVAGRSPGL